MPGNYGAGTHSLVLNTFVFFNFFQRCVDGQKRILKIH